MLALSLHNRYNLQNEHQYSNHEWDVPAHHWNEHFLKNIDTWLATQKETWQKPPAQNKNSNILAGCAEQKLVFNIIQHHHASETLKPLHMLITGTAGTGKSFVLRCVNKELKSDAHLCATTGSAGCLIDAGTLHSLFNLPVSPFSYHDLQGIQLQKLEDKWEKSRENPCKTYFFVDECSQLGKRTLYWMDRRMRQATKSVALPFGGLSIILIGDFAQLPSFRILQCGCLSTYQKRKWNTYKPPIYFNCPNNGHPTRKLSS